MDYLDEDTLVWDGGEQSFVAPNSTPDQPKDKRVLVGNQQIEFLRHFDKAENQLINISSELLSITLKIQTLPEPEDLSTLRHQLVKSINEIKAKGAELTYPVAVIDKLCFLYAVVLDEFIIYTDWGEKRGWENKTLLSELFGMRNGGELFFTVADKALRQPHKLIDLLEIIYIFLNVGFRGQYQEAGSEQRKLFIHQLEQIISQYRQIGGIFCHTKVILPKVRKPSRKKRYWITTLFFVCLITTTIALTQFWYNKTHDQRARDFSFLTDYSQRYVLSGEVSDIVFISSDKDLQSAPQRGSKLKAIASPTVTVAPSQTDWLVQLATFSTEKNARAYVNQLPPSSYHTQVDQYRAYFRVIIRTESIQQAREIKDWFSKKASIKPIIVQTSGSVDSKEESN
ncbi:type IVB secretion system protein IcmH/DotU [Vibrio sp. NTOU-M3]|uniref:type IVB secretion system protein IcmH/DotU n=1 Tax=Vibrio sp. NTOU-M3 TaxID=3234954 RepID=UPI00349F68C3